MESSIWVATITGFAAFKAFSTNFFCVIGTSAAGISIPKSPRATIMPSTASKISSIFRTASLLSILAIIRIGSTGFIFNCFSYSTIKNLKSRISCALLTKESATKSTFWLMPNFKSILSFSVRQLISTSESGVLMPL